jgi:hypothetical protein
MVSTTKDIDIAYSASSAINTNMDCHMQYICCMIFNANCTFIDRHRLRITLILEAFRKCSIVTNHSIKALDTSKPTSIDLGFPEILDGWDVMMQANKILGSKVGS